MTPPPQWGVVGGFTERQFAEKRTIEELNAVAADTPVFILHLYDRALLNGAALRVVGYTKDTPSPPGGEIVVPAIPPGCSRIPGGQRLVSNGSMISIRFWEHVGLIGGLMLAAVLASRDQRERRTRY